MSLARTNRTHQVLHAILFAVVFSLTACSSQTNEQKQKESENSDDQQSLMQKNSEPRSNQSSNISKSEDNSANRNMESKSSNESSPSNTSRLEMPAHDVEVKNNHDSESPVVKTGGSRNEVQEKSEEPKETIGNSAPEQSASSQQTEQQSEPLISPEEIQTTLKISEAKWESGDNYLIVKGLGDNHYDVVIKDAESGMELGMAVFKESDSSEWRYRLRNPEFIPCTVSAEANGVHVEKPLENAPINCGLAVSSPGPTPTPLLGQLKVFAFNDLGMHCMDDDFSVFSVLPPFNTINAQVIQMGTKGSLPRILTNSEVELKYSATMDPNGSINSSSIGKTNFWEYSQDLFGATLEPNTGLLGAKMPNGANGPQAFPHFNTSTQWFGAEGIPITPIDDNGDLNPYSLFKISAHALNSNERIADLDIVVPVSSEMNCDDCHRTGEVAARSQNIHWSTNGDNSKQTKENILILHDNKHGTDLNTRLTSGGTRKPVLCAECHYSPALDLSASGPQGSQVGKSFMSHAMHTRHGLTMQHELPDASNDAVIPDTGANTCYNCHPGRETKCFRGAMFKAEVNCQDCHGGLLQVGGYYPLASGNKRMPWVDLPKCQSCHTGDAVNHQGESLILTTAFDANDNTATAFTAVNKRFAENDNTLYRNSLGHGGVACASCHGSPHAIWPVADTSANDNIASKQLQGYSHFVTECTTCHEAGSLPLTLNGPHGMHNVNDSRWNINHEELYERNPAACKTCHGENLQGTVLSKTATDRLLRTDDEGGGTILLAKGTEVSCDLCHEKPR